MCLVEYVGDQVTESATSSETAIEVHELEAGSFNRLLNLTSFVGRDQETTWVRERLLAGHRIVTITGPGGVGKTRLATNIATSPELRFAFPHGVTFISLAQVSDPSMVIPTIARQLGIHADESTSAVYRLSAALEQKRMLLIIDNLEHVIAAAIDLKRFVDSCQQLSILVTSRRAMRVSGEQEFSLSPLPLPASGGQLLEQLNESPAVRLFLDRAAAANPSFTLTAENASAIAEICYRLDGLPLALELAAARTKMLAPQALASRLTSRLQLLTTGPRDAPIRQQTLRETVRWSYDLLTPFEQLIFRRMAVFGGGASLEAIGAVAGQGAPISELEILDVVATLVEQSLLERDEAPGQEARFRMLETIREFAIGELTATGEIDRIRDAHAAYFLRVAEYSAGDEYGEDESARIMALEPDVSNIRLALGWLLIDREFDSPNVHMGLRLAGAMSRYWDIRGYITEGREWLIHALSTVPEEPTADRATALTALGVNSWFAGKIEESEAWQYQALAIWRELNMRVNEVRSLWFLAIAAAKRGDIERLDELHMEAEPVAALIDRTLWRIVPVAIRALARLMVGDGNGAMKYLQSALEFHEQHRYHWPRAWTLGVMAEAAMVEGDRQASLKLTQASLSEFARRGDVYAMLDGILVCAQHSITLGDPETSAKLLGVVQRVRRAVGTRMTWTNVTDEDLTATVRGALGDARMQEVMRASGMMQLQDGVTLALSVGGERQQASKPAPPVSGFGLSPRELEILQLLAQGKSNQEIGDELFISHRTAGTHVANILGKLGVHSRAAAVAVAINNELV